MFTDCLEGWDTGQNGEFHWSRLPSVFPADARVSLRDNVSFEDTELSYAEYADYLEQCAPGLDVSEMPLYYGKDLHPPAEWLAATQRNMPKQFLEKEGGDLLACPDQPSFAPETLMVYLGVDGTYTCAHFDLCATLGHNLLLDSDPGPTSIWFMMRSCDHAAASKFWEENGGCLEKDNCFLSWDVLAFAPFPVYVVLQGKGDFVLVPSDGAHQVFNKGRNVKISWNRFPPSCIEAAYWRVLPRYRAVARNETYRIVGLAYHGMSHWSALVEQQLRDGGDAAALLLCGRDLHALLAVMGDFVFNMRLDEKDEFWDRFLLPPLSNDEEEVEEEEAAFQDEEEEQAEKKNGETPAIVAATAAGDAKPTPKKKRKVRSTRTLAKSVSEKDPRKWTRVEKPLEPPQVLQLPEETLTTVLTCDICNADIFCRFVKCDACEADNKACDFCVRCVSEQRGCVLHREQLRMCQVVPLEAILARYESAYAVYVRACVKAQGQLPQLAPIEDVMSAARRSDTTMAALLMSGALRSRETGCHQCRGDVSKKACHDMVPCSRCANLYCDQCIWNRYGDKLTAKLQAKKWVCYACKKTCNCDRCKATFNFMSFLPYGARTISTVPSYLLPLHDRAAPTHTITGIGAHSFKFLVPLRVYPAPEEWQQVAFVHQLLVRNKQGQPWPARRALCDEEEKAADWGRPKHVCVSFFGGLGTAWVALADVALHPRAEDYRAARPDDVAAGKRYDKAVEKAIAHSKPVRKQSKKRNGPPTVAAGAKKEVAEAVTDPAAEIDQGQVKEEEDKMGQVLDEQQYTQVEVEGPRAGEAMRDRPKRAPKAPKRRKVDREPRERPKRPPQNPEVVMQPTRLRQRVARVRFEEDDNEDEELKDQSDDSEAQMEMESRAEKQRRGSAAKKFKESEGDLPDVLPVSAFEQFCREHSGEEGPQKSQLWSLAKQFIKCEAENDGRIGRERRIMGRLRQKLRMLFGREPQYDDPEVGEWILVEWLLEATDQTEWYRGQVVKKDRLGGYQVLYDDGQLLCEEELQAKQVRRLPPPQSPIAPLPEAKATLAEAEEALPEQLEVELEHALKESQDQGEEEEEHEEEARRGARRRSTSVKCKSLVV